jgi:hypothetical protein
MWWQRSQLKQRILVWRHQRGRQFLDLGLRVLNITGQLTEHRFVGHKRRVDTFFGILLRQLGQFGLQLVLRVFEFVLVMIVR